MSGFRYFYPAAVTIGLVPWIAGGLLLGKTGLMIGLVASFLGIMLLNDANRQHVQEQRRRMRRSMKRRGQI